MNQYTQNKIWYFCGFSTYQLKFKKKTLNKIIFLKFQNKNLIKTHPGKPQDDIISCYKCSGIGFQNILHCPNNQYYWFWSAL